MPRLAATLASILLIVSSIGVNITRYPQVGRTIDPAPAGAAETASPSQAANEALRVEKPEATQMPAKSEVVATTASETQSGFVKNEPFADRMVAVGPQPSAAQTDGNVPIVDVRPMVPVESTQTSGKESPANAGRFQRLPPVESSGQAHIDDGAADDAKSYPVTATP